MTSGTSQAPSAARPVLQRWLTGAPGTHPVRVLEAETGTNPAVPMGLDALETMAAALDGTAADNPRWSRKIAEFGQLTSMGQLLEMRAEFALALTDAGIGYELGDTKISNPDLLLLASSGALCAGIEVTARAPHNINELVERVEAVSAGQFDVDLAFDGYPSRLQPEIADKAAAAVRAQADALGAGSPAVTEVIQVEDPKNGGPLEITVQVCPGNGAVGWEVTAGILDGPLGAAEYAAFEARPRHAEGGPGSLPGRRAGAPRGRRLPLRSRVDAPRHRMGPATRRRRAIHTRLPLRRDRCHAPEPRAAGTARHRRRPLAPPAGSRPAGP
ncbi:hypothetical protein ACIO1C_34695 [Streptomyces sp. NPDC087420]|uniref:hypothetical protein n=1 Tax=Streptomyces sp. NPDC087420 TaxID=3365785 RepID=UPI0038399C5E